MDCLEMIRSLEGPLPEFIVPEGYTIVSINEDNGHLWEQVMDVTWGGHKHRPGDFRYVFVSNIAYEEDRVFALLDESGRAVATAAIVDYKVSDWNYEYDPLLAFVGVPESCRGHGFARFISLHCLQEMKKLGYSAAHVDIGWTEDGKDNIPATKTYINCGFEPYIVDQRQEKVWRTLYERLSIPCPTFHYAEKGKPGIGDLLKLRPPLRPSPYQVRCAAEALAAGDTYIFGKWDRHNLYLVNPDRYIQLKPLLKQSDAYEDIVKWIMKKRVKAIYIDRPRNPQALLAVLKNKKHIRIGTSDDERFERGVEAYLKA